MSSAQSIVLKQKTNVEQKSNAHLDHVVNSMFDVGEQKFDFQQTVTASDDRNPFHIEDYPDLSNLFVETETLNWARNHLLDRRKLQILQSECRSLQELFKITNKDNKEEIR